MEACLRLTIIVPAFNEEAWLAPTLDSVHAAAERLCARSRVDLEMIVVDNNSNDGTATVARSRGATVVQEPVQGIARARNTGARHAVGDVLGSLRGLARESRRTVRLIQEPRVRPSCRRFDQWPPWKILLWTNPLSIVLFRRWKPAWKGWYSDPVR